MSLTKSVVVAAVAAHGVSAVLMTQRAEEKQKCTDQFELPDEVDIDDKEQVESLAEALAKGRELCGQGKASIRIGAEDPEIQDNVEELTTVSAAWASTEDAKQKEKKLAELMKAFADEKHEEFLQQPAKSVTINSFSTKDGEFEKWCCHRPGVAKAAPTAEAGTQTGTQTGAQAGGNAAPAKDDGSC